MTTLDWGLTSLTWQWPATNSSPSAGSATIELMGRKLLSASVDCSVMPNFCFSHQFALHTVLQIQPHFVAVKTLSGNFGMGTTAAVTILLQRHLCLKTSKVRGSISITQPSGFTITNL